MMRNCKLIRYNKSKQVICFTSTSIWIYTIYTASKLSTKLLCEHNILIHHRSVQHQLWLKNYFHRLQWYQISHSTHLSYIQKFTIVQQIHTFWSLSFLNDHYNFQNVVIFLNWETPFVLFLKVKVKYRNSESKGKFKVK